MPTPAPYASWPLNDNAGNGAWADSTGGGHPLTGAGAPTSAAGRNPTGLAPTTAAAFNGTNQSMSGAVPVNLTAGFEMAGLVYYNAFGEFDCVAGWHQAVLYTSPANDPRQPTLNVTRPDGSHVEVHATGAPPLSGFWYPLQAYYDPTAQLIGIRFNGGPWATLSVPAGVIAGPTTFYVGDQGSGLWLNGRLQSWSVWQGNLSPADRDAVLAALGGTRYTTVSLVLGEGNSLMWGYVVGGTQTANQPMAALNVLLQADGPYRESGWTTVNRANGGESTEQSLAQNSTNPGGDWRAYYDPARQDNWVVLWEGHNSLVYGDSAAQAYSVATTYVAGAKALGWKVALGTVIADGGTDWSPGLEASRQAYNALVRANAAGADKVVDFAADARLSDATNTAYYQADRTHLSDGGYELAGALIYRALFGTSDFSHVAANFPDLAEALAAFLAADGVVAANFPGGASNGAADRDTPLPFVAFVVAEVKPVVKTLFGAWVEHVTVNFHCVAAGADQAERLGATLRGRLAPTRSYTPTPLLFADGTERARFFAGPGSTTLDAERGYSNSDVFVHILPVTWIVARG